MKHALILLLLTITLGNATAQGIEFFHGEWKAALEEAQKADKLIFIDAYAKWCGPCKRMAKNVFPQPEVGKFFNDNFINLKLDMEESDGRSFGSKYAVTAFPTLFFLSPDGKIVKKTTGGRDEAGLIALGKEAILGWDKSGDYAEKYEAGDRDYDLVLNYVKELNKVNKPSLKISNDYIKSDPDITDAQMAGFLVEAVTESDSKIYEKLMEMKTLALKAAGKETFRKKVRSAALATVAKAVEFEYPQLKDDAITAYKTAGLDDVKKFEQEAMMYYYQLNGDYAEWKKLSEKYLKKYAKKESDLYMSQLSALKNFGHEKDSEYYACEICKDMVKKDKTASNYNYYIENLIKCKKFKEAKKVTNEAIKKYKDDEPTLKRFEKILEYLNTI